MRRSFLFVSFVAAAVAGALLPAHARAQDSSPVAGVWTLNRSLSEFPADIGFNPAWMTAAAREAGQGGGSSAGGRGRRGSSGGGDSRPPASPFSSRQENSEDARRIQLLTGEARNPPARLMIVDAPGTVTITNELGQSRTLHPEGKEETVEIQGVPIGVTSTRAGNELVSVYRIDRDREIRYIYSASATPSQLIVDVQFLERGKGDRARRIYEPAVETRPAPPPPAGAPPQPTGAGAPPAASGPPAVDAFDQRPGAELRGLNSLGVLVEELSPQAVACGLSRDAIESALSRQLTAGGFSVRRNSDEDTYVYVNIMTSSLPGGTCVSRYDAFLYSHATAKLSYRERPVLVQVSLMHRGGIGTSAPSGHGAAVTRGLAGFVDLFVTQIHDANK
jgi:hypothetical protein